jgi:hypothetical protein
MNIRLWHELGYGFLIVSIFHHFLLASLCVFVGFGEWEKITMDGDPETITLMGWVCNTRIMVHVLG